jgi:4-amino-4-deoxy-L-arabinose transferase-like glycosyltransferase
MTRHSAVFPAWSDFSAPAARAWRIGLVFALVFAWLLRVVLVWASQASLHVDEAQYWDWSRHLQWGYYSKPPVIAALIRTSTSLFGDSELGLRLLSMLCWPLMALVLAGLGAMLAQAGVAGTDPAPPDAARGVPRPVQVGVAAALIWLCSPLAGLLGMVATTDTPLLLCWAVALYALWSAVMLGRDGAWWAFGLACGVGLLDKYTMAALLPGAALWVLRYGQAHHRWRYLGAVLLALALLAPNLIWNAAADWPTLRHTADITVRATAGSDSWARAPGRLLEFVLGQWVMLGPLVLLGALSWRVWRKPAAPSAAALPRMPAAVAGLLLWTSAPLLALGLLQAARGHAEINWIAPVHLAAALALAHVAPHLRRWRGAAWLLAVQLGLISWVCMAPLWLQNSHPGLAATLDPWRRMRGWQEALAELEPYVHAPGAGAPAEGVVLMQSRAVLAQAAYHWRHTGVRRAAWTPQARPESHYQLTCPWRPGQELVVQGPVWVLADGPVPADMAAALGGLQWVAQAQVRRLGRVNADLQLLRALHPPVAPPAGAGAAGPYLQTCP